MINFCFLLTVVHDLSITLGVNFYDLYALTGLCNCFFMATYGILGLNSLIKFSTRSVEEIFSMFIVICFSVDSLKDLYQSKIPAPSGIELI